MRLLVLLTKFAHHGDNSGYKQLIKFTKPLLVLGVDEEDSQAKHGLKGKYQWLYEWEAMRYRKQVDLIHIMYGEDYFRFSPWLFSKLPIVVTFHQPYESLLREVRKGDYKGRVGAITHFFTKKRFQKISAAIVTEASQKAALSEVMDANKIHVIPLGVHLGSFSEAFENFRHKGLLKEARQVITVGNWKRDWQLYEEVVKLATAENKGIHFHLVNRNLSEDLNARLTSLGVIIHKNIDDQLLKQLIYQSSVMYLPVTEASGNNALLEALALGVPVVMTNVLKEAPALSGEVLTLHEKGSVFSALNDLLSYLNKDKHSMISINDICRQEAKRFDWPEIANRTIDLYKKVLGL